jgi:hypothetical protein
MRERRKTVAGRWTLPRSDSSKKKKKGEASGCWAGAVIGPATVFWKAGPVEVQS